MTLMPKDEVGVSSLNCSEGTAAIYGRCARFAVIGMDNDGNLDLTRSGLPKTQATETLAACAAPSILAVGVNSMLAEATRPELNWLPGKPGFDGLF